MNIPTYLVPCAFLLFLLQGPCLLHLQDLLLRPPIAAKLVHQTSPHYSLFSATLWLQTSGEQQSLHCQPERYLGYEGSVVEQCQCFSILLQLVWAHAVHQKGHHWNLEWIHWNKQILEVYLLGVAVIFFRKVDGLCMGRRRTRYIFVTANIWLRPY